MADNYDRYYSQQTSPPRPTPHTQTWEYPPANNSENGDPWAQQGYPQPAYPSNRQLPPYPNQVYQNYLPPVPDYPTGYEAPVYPAVSPPPAPTFDNTDVGHSTNHRYSNIHRSHTYGRNSTPPERVNTRRETGTDPYVPTHISAPLGPNLNEQGPERTAPIPTEPATFHEQKISQDNAIFLLPSDQKKGEKTIFLEFEQQVKKVVLPETPSLSSLVQMFVDKFGCTFEQKTCPPLYIKDQATQVWYELEDLNELSEKSHLKLKVTDDIAESKVEKIQKQVDEGFSMLANEMKELKSFFRSDANNLSTSDGTLQRSNTIAAIGSIRSKDSSHAINKMRGPLLGGSSVQQEKIRQFQKEIRSLRTELSVVKQLYSEFQKETSHMLSNIASNTLAFKEKLEKTPQTSRTVIDTGINKLEQKAISVYDRMHDLQDLIDDMKALVIKNGKPSKFQMDFALKESEAIAAELIGQRNYVDEVTPGWKKNFEEELKHIISCQEFLKKHQALLNDLEDEHKESQTLLDQLGKILELKAKTVVKPITIDVASAEEKHDVLGNVFQEIACVDPDSDRRLKALAQSEKIRRWELENKVDEFEAELNDFVGSKKLRKTGGTEELERLREKRNRETLTALLQQQVSPPPNPPPAPAPVPAPPSAEPADQTI